MGGSSEYQSKRVTMPKKGPAVEVSIQFTRAKIAECWRDWWNRKLPEVITVDIQPDFTSKAVDEWGDERGLKLNFIWSGKLIRNGSLFYSYYKKACGKGTHKF